MAIKKEERKTIERSGTVKSKSEVRAKGIALTSGSVVVKTVTIKSKDIDLIIPKTINPSWMVAFLKSKEFSPYYFSTLKNIYTSSDRVLSNILNITPKTLNKYTKDVSSVKTSTKEHVIMLLSLMKHGIDVFGTKEDFDEWLNKPNLFLDNNTPLSYLDTNNGIRFIDNRLTAMEYGDNI